ncbi:MAG: UvrD-helicase domain-containing protein, partial [Acutalibacteraceae bacterium]
MATEEFFNLRKQIIEQDFTRMNDRQKEAIFHVNGPLLILAGAGSGKTTVLVNRIANLVKYGDAYNSRFVAFEPSENDISLMKQYLDGDEDVLFDIEDLLSDNPAKPWQILAITFTNKAANELKERLEKMLGDEAKEIWASTF